jgi:hypothetical protein
VRILVLATALVLISCSDPKRASTPAAAAKVSGVSSVEPYFPLEEGRIYNYVTTENGETGMLIAKVHRTDAAHGELRLSNATKRFVYGADSVGYDGGATLLKGPLDVGASWPGEHGGTTRVVTTSASPKVPAGAYSACVQTIEEGGRLAGAKFATTYCPGVGMVLLEINVAGGEARAELKSYAPPFRID